MRSSGRHLVEFYWGSYIAVIYSPTAMEWHLLRDPTANLACFHAKIGGVDVFFSDFGDFQFYAETVLSVNVSHIAARLLGGFAFSRECALREVEDVPGGELITISAGVARRTLLWHPAQFCAEDSLTDAHKAVEALRGVVCSVVSTLASERDNVLSLLSGGIDSSIVTACLAQVASGTSVTCLNFYTSADASLPSADYVIPGLSSDDLIKVRRAIGSADERQFARAVVRECGFNLVEKQREVGALDFARLYKAPLAPRPSSYGFVIDLDDAESECAAANGATGCFTGQGGDTVFYAALGSIGALDYAYLHPTGTHLAHEILSTANLSRESVLRVLSKVIRHGLLRRPLPSSFEQIKRPHLLQADVATAASSGALTHPWVEAAGRLCPGKYKHVLGVTDSVPTYHHVFHRERIAPSVNPLAAQPVVETCLRIPTYVLLAGGVSRGLAKLAFQDILPKEVRRRNTKGTGIAYYQNFVRRNIRAIREHLLGGFLIREQLLDGNEVEKYLTAEQPFLTVQPDQILDYLCCEAWLNQIDALNRCRHSSRPLQVISAP